MPARTCIAPLAAVETRPGGFMAQVQYITPAELAESYDARVLAELSSDDGRIGTIDTDNEILVNAIERASADLESYVLRGGRHSVVELTALKDADDWTLKGLVATLAVVHLYRRRGRDVPPALRDAFTAATASLEDLGSGKQVFNDTGAIAAGKPSVTVVPPATRDRLRMVSDEPYFPVRRMVD